MTRPNLQLLPTADLGAWSRPRMQPDGAFHAHTDDGPAEELHRVDVNGKAMLSDRVVILDPDLVQTYRPNMPTISDNRLVPIRVTANPSCSAIGVHRARLSMLQHLDLLGHVELHLFDPSVAPCAVAISVDGRVVAALALYSGVDRVSVLAVGGSLFAGAPVVDGRVAREELGR